MSTDPARPRRASADDGLLRLGLVGRAGSGKSTVADALERSGARVLRADQLGHQVTDQDPAVRAALIAEYGPGIYRADGTLDRARVAAKVFTDRAALARLDKLTHPRIVILMQDELDALQRAGWRGVVVFDAALMLDWGMERVCDAVIAVVAPEESKIARLVASRGWTEAEARARLAAQRSDESFAAAADVVLQNDGTRGDLARAALEAVGRLRLAHGKGNGQGC